MGITRERYFIFDASAFSHGIGNIQKLVEDGKYDIVLFVPSYTIGELDFLKKGVSMMATNARESIRFIEKVVSSEISCISRRIILEDATDPIPGWRKCIQQQACSPRVSEFDNANKSVRPTGDEDDAPNSIHKVLIKDKGRSKRATMPATLKYLIKPCVQKVHFETEDWKFIREDVYTLIWAQSFEIPCANISRAERAQFNEKHNIIASKPKNKEKTSAKSALENKPRIAKFECTEFARRVRVSLGLHDDNNWDNARQNFDFHSSKARGLSS